MKMRFFELWRMAAGDGCWIACMILSRGDATTFVTRPISAILLTIAVAVLIIVFLPSVKRKREEVFVEEA